MTDDSGDHIADVSNLDGVAAPPVHADVIVLGAGFGGLELTTRLSEEFGDEIELVLIDQSDAFVFGFSKLDVMFGRATPDAVRLPYADIVKPGVKFVQSAIRKIDPQTQTRPDRRGRVRSRRPGRGLGCRPRPRGDARFEGGRPRVLYGPRRVCGARRARSVRGRSRDHRRAVDAVQMPAGAERDSAATPRAPGRARASRQLGRSRW